MHAWINCKLCRTCEICLCSVPGGYLCARELIDFFIFPPCLKKKTFFKINLVPNMGLGISKSHRSLEWPIICNHSRVHTESPLPIRESVNIHGSPLKHSVATCSFTHHRLQLSLHRVESEKDLSYAALIAICRCPIQVCTFSSQQKCKRYTPPLIAQSHRQVFPKQTRKAFYNVSEFQLAS